MRRLFSISVLLVISINACFSQWPQVFGSEYFYAFTDYTRETYDKGFLLNLDFRSEQSAPLGSLLIKTDVNGNELWRKRIGNSTNHLEIRGITLDPQNNIYICGGIAELIGDEYRDPFIMKLNPCMEVEWCNIYQTLEFDDIALQMVYIEATNSIAVNFSYHVPTHPVSIANFNTDGEKLWENYFFENPQTWDPKPVGLVNSMVDSSLMLYGYTGVQNDSFAVLFRVPQWLKIDYNGNLIWEKLIDSASFYFSTPCERPMFINDNIMVAGVTGNKLLQFDYDSGEIESIKNLYNPDTIPLSTLNCTEHHNGFIYSGVQYIVSQNSNNGSGSLQKNDLQGNFISETILPVNFATVIEDICITHDSNLLISAHNSTKPDVMLIKYTEDLEYTGMDTISRVYDSLCPYGITSGTIQLDCNIITSIISRPENELNTLTFSPNPAEEYTVIYLPTYRSNYVDKLTLNILNISGQVILSAPWPDLVKEHVINVSGYHPGLYLVQVMSQTKTIATGKLMVK